MEYFTENTHTHTHTHTNNNKPLCIGQHKKFKTYLDVAQLLCSIPIANKYIKEKGVGAIK